MKTQQLDIVVLGLSITSSWGNGHATTYRCLLRGLARRGHRVVFLERDVPWYASNRDARGFPFATVGLYRDLRDLKNRFAREVRDADFVIVGSYVPEGSAAGEWVLNTARGVTAFYDIDTPVTLAKLRKEDYEYLNPALIREYGLYLSFTGGPTLREIERDFGARMCRPLYCAVDPKSYFTEPRSARWDLAFLGTYSQDRQGALEELLMRPARQAGSRRFAVAGSMFPDAITWPENVDRIEHLAPGDHREFYNAQRYTLNVTRDEMIRAGYSPSVRLFEATACGTPVISDNWPGLNEFFEPGKEILLADSAADVARFLWEVPDEQRAAIGERARARTLSLHTGGHRARELEEYFVEAAALRQAV